MNNHLGVLVFLIALAGCAASEEVEDRPPSVADVLTTWAQRSGYQLIVPECAMGTRARHTRELEAVRALGQMLAGTSLRYTFVNARTVAIRCNGLQL